MLDIENAWVDSFLVCDLYENGKLKGVCGTICFRKQVKDVTFKGSRIPRDTFEIFSLSTDKRARGIGVAKSLMTSVEAEAKKAGVNVYLETSSAQLPAIALYKRMGYECTEGMALQKR